MQRITQFINFVWLNIHEDSHSIETIIKNIEKNTTIEIFKKVTSKKTFMLRNQKL